MSNAPGAICDAATVIVLREQGPRLETFMLCRHSQSGFMGGAHVFPGGKLDASDCTSVWQSKIDRPAASLGTLLGEPDADPSIARGLWVAGVRETFEEAGVLLARANESADFGWARRRLERGGEFSELLTDLEASISVDALTPYARWITPKMESRRFDTRFFIAVLPEHQEASHDGTETVSAVWLEPTTALDRMRSGEIKLAPPTVRTLDWLASFDSAASAIDHAASRPPPLVQPRIVAGKGSWFLALPGDPEHPESEAVLPGSTRMVLDGNAWVDAPMPVA